jgi:hypothetical protein
MAIKNMREIGWNGIRLNVPASWETIVKEKQSLLFEDDFRPLLQLRWEKTGPLKKRAIEKRGKLFWPSPSFQLDHTKLHYTLKEIHGGPGTVIFYGEKAEGSLADLKVTGGIRYCPQSETLVVFQFLDYQKFLLPIFAQILLSLNSQDTERILWSVQDFSLRTPLDLQLDSFTFAAGLTRLSFSGPDYWLQCCKLAPADMRLKQQSVQEILTTLCGTEEIEIRQDLESTTCTGYRYPSLGKQILYRMKREKPFIAARLWHWPDANRLLAVVLSSKSPLSLSTLDTLCSQYEIIS